MRALARTTCLVVAILAVPGSSFGDTATARARWVAELSAADAERRIAAAHGLARLGRDARSTAPRLLPLLDDPVPAVRAEALAALRAIGARNERVATAAWTSVGEDPDKSVRKAALALAKRQDADTPGAASALRRCLDSAHASARKAALARLGDGAGHRGDVGRILELALDDEDRGVQKRALATLAALGSPLHEHQERLRARLRDGSVPQKLQAARLLGAIASTEDAPALEDASLRALSELLLDSESSKLRRAALAPLEDHGAAHRELAAVFLDALTPTGTTRSTSAAQGLAALGTGSAAEVEALLAICLDPELLTGAARKALVKLAAEREALPHVIAELSSPSARRRELAVVTLAGVGLGAAEAGPKLIELARTDEEADVRDAALEAVAATQPAAVARPVLEAAVAKDTDKAVRSTARVELRTLDQKGRRALAREEGRASQR